jgi:thiosulfate/3-mercaptopyruvate sulfurtransferase
MNKTAIALVTFFSLVCIVSGNSYAIGDKPLETEKVAVNLVRETERGGYKIMTAQDLKSWVDQKKNMLIVDAASAEGRYGESHVPGAAQFEFPEQELALLDDKKKADFEKLLGPDRDRLLVFYCGYTECIRSHNAAMWAVRLGYRNVYRQPGGMGAWKEAGYPVESVK